MYNINSSLIKKFMTSDRLKNYIDIEEYSQNLKFSRKSYIPLSILEIALRNSLNGYFISKIGNDWLESDFLTIDSQKKVKIAKNTLLKNRKELTNSNLVAELSFGFWVNLLREPYREYLRISDLKKIFPNLPTKDKEFINRVILFKKLNHIRNFRNRVFHYEKVINNKKYSNILKDINQIVNYFDTELENFINYLEK